MHTAPANSAMFISQVTFFCFELSLGRGAALRCNICFLNRARRGDTWLAMRKLPPAPVPYAKALPAPVATWLAMRKLPLSHCRFTLPVTGVNFLSDDDGHPIFELLPPAITATGIPASFEQTQRVPTGHPDVCLCDVSGATN